MAEGCQKRIGDVWYMTRCNNTPTELVGQEQLCKRHAAAQRGANTAKARRQAQDEAEQAEVKAWRERMETASAKLGVRGRLNWNWVSRKPTAEVVISLEDFEQLAERRERLRNT